MCKVSVIIPVYNSEEYIEECLNSILRQTLNDIEIICINDGSTDKSVDILQRFCNIDSRINIIDQENQGAGASRNHGMEVAKGEYLSFLDADDYYEPDMLERAYENASKNNADICIFNGDYFSSEDKTFKHKKHWLNKQYIENTEGCINRENEKLLLCTNAAAWNKVYRRMFVEKFDLKFQEIEWANDVYFTYTAMALAIKITMVDKVLIHYRVRRNQNIQSLSYQNPLCFCMAFEAVKRKLQEEEVYKDIEYGFINAFLNHTIHHLKKLKSNENKYKELITHLRERYIYSCDLVGKPKEFFEEKKNYDMYVQEILNVDLNRYKHKIKRLRNEIQKLKEREMKIKQSHSYKIGRAITFLPRTIKKYIKLWS